jgi:hypothetical protein
VADSSLTGVLLVKLFSSMERKMLASTQTAQVDAVTG